MGVAALAASRADVTGRRAKASFHHVRVVVLAKADGVEGDCLVDEPFVPPAPEHACGEEDQEDEADEAAHTENNSRENFVLEETCILSGYCC